jgi:hypothetical protein
MTAVDSSVAVADRTLSGAVLGTNHRQEAEESPTVRLEELISEPNRRTDAYQTWVYRGDGDSNVLLIGPPRLRPTVPSVPVPREFFRAMQKWEGYVTEVDQDTFRARLARVLGEGPDQEAEIYTEEVDEADRALIQPGAVFYWSIGYLDRPSGRVRASIIRFRRLPVWTKRELDSASAEADRLKGLLHGD